MKFDEMIREARRGNWNLKEFLTRSEGTELFTDSLNTMLIEGFNGMFISDVASIYNTVTITQGRTLRFPSVRGINPDIVPELAEFSRADQEITAVSIEVQKFGKLIGISREMIDDNEVGLIGLRAKMAGAAHANLQRQELVKALSFYATGPSVSTGAVGFTDHGIRYPQLGYTNFLSATALNWETIIARCRAQLWTQRVTITAKGIDFPFPVMADFILANPHHEMSVRKVLQASVTVIGTGAVTDAGGSSNVAGSNLFKNVISNLIFDPTIPTGQAIIGASKKGAVVVRKDDLQLDEFNNIYFDANDLRTRERFLPAVVEDRYFMDVQMSG